MDALPGVGHACGHNLIAISGVAVACAIKKAIIKHNISGTVILLGTPGECSSTLGLRLTLNVPGEEGGMGKKIMLEAGAYKDMVGCVMCHPAPGPNATSSLSSTLALQRMTAKYKGRR
jgi:metal-dependent amidase/aminoacylase/carboxypeptidase family protein